MATVYPDDPDEVPGEVGRQNERTTLAWRRTNMTALGVAALTAKVSGQTVVALIVLGVAFATSAAIGSMADRRTLRRATAIDDWEASVGGAALVAAAPLAVVTAAGLTVALALTGIVIVLV